MLEQLLDLLFTIARADGDITPLEWAYLQEVAHIFGYDETEFSRLSEIYSGIHPAPHLVLGVSADAELSEVRNAWKQLARDHHPDQMIAAGMPEEFVRAATDRLSGINRAYELMSQTIATRQSSSNSSSQSQIHS
jgi:DnaJ like chaperone protein